MYQGLYRGRKYGKSFQESLERKTIRINRSRQKIKAVKNILQNKIAIVNCRQEHRRMLTIHGLRFLAASDRPLYERIFWLVALLAVCFYMFITIAAQIRKYLNNPVLMSMNNEIIPISKIPYPAITFCNTNQIFESFANLTYLLDKDTLTEEESNLLDASLTLCSDYKVRYSSMMESKSFNLATNRLLLEYGAKSCARVVKAYEWESHWNYNPCELIQITPTILGSCFTFNMLPADQLLNQEWFDDFQSMIKPDSTSYQYKYFSQEKIWDAESGYLSSHINGKIPWRSSNLLEQSASFILDINIDDMVEMCMLQGPGFMVVIHNPAETPTAYHAIASAEKDSRTAIVVTPKLVLTSDDLKSWLPEERGCYYNHERKLRYFKYYTQNNCNTECEINATLEKCNCLQPHHTHLHLTPVCGGFAMKCYVGVLYEALDDFRSSHCKCLPACTELTYEVYSYKTPRNFQYFNLTDRMIPGNIANVETFFKTKTVINLQRVGIVTAGNVIASIGGLMSLFLGFSFISVFEAIYIYIIRRITNKWRSY